MRSSGLLRVERGGLRLGIARLLFELERLHLEIALLRLGGFGARVGLGPLALKRGFGLLDLAGGLLRRPFLGLLAVGFRNFLGAALLDLSLETLALGGRLDLVASSCAAASACWASVRASAASTAASP